MGFHPRSATHRDWLFVGVLLVMWLSLVALVGLGSMTVDDGKGLLGMLLGLVSGWLMPSPLKPI